MRYYIDTCVWIDFIEGHEYAEEIFFKAIHDEDTILVSDLMSKEFLRYKEYSGIHLLITLLESKKLIEHVNTHAFQDQEAITLSDKKNVPKPDALHAILARDNNAILITKDKHFKSLIDICRVKLF